jgi:hypothetical protein
MLKILVNALLFLTLINFSSNEKDLNRIRALLEKRHSSSMETKQNQMNIFSNQLSEYSGNFAPDFVPNNDNGIIYPPKYDPRYTPNYGNGYPLYAPNYLPGYLPSENKIIYPPKYGLGLLPNQVNGMIYPINYDPRYPPNYGIVNQVYPPRTCPNFNPIFEICCNGNLNRKSGLEPKCCGARSFDAHFELCCFGQVQKKSGINPQCCGARSFDAHFEICCFGQVQKKIGFKNQCQY